jgi:hypothetical protein
VALLRTDPNHLAILLRNQRSLKHIQQRHHSTKHVIFISLETCQYIQRKNR